MSGALPPGPGDPGTMPGGPGGDVPPDRDGVPDRAGPAAPLGWLDPLARHRWYTALGVGCSLVLLAGGAAAMLSRHPAPATHELAADCGLVRCGAALPTAPASSLGPAAPGTRAGKPAASARPSAARRSRRAAPVPAPTAGKPKPTTPSPVPPSPHATARPSPTPTPARTPSPRPSPTKAAPPDVTVSYTLSSGHHDSWSQRFQGVLTIVNHGSATVGGWTIQLSFPGDSIDWIGYRHGGAATPFNAWQASGGSVTLSAASGSEALAPGATQQVTIDAQGSTTSPTACTFDGTACTP